MSPCPYPPCEECEEGLNSVRDVLSPDEWKGILIWIEELGEDEEMSLRCPGLVCSSLTYVIDRYVLESTDGPIEHVTLLCDLRHRFTVRTEDLSKFRVEAYWPKAER